jgi:hypothetical protein
MSIEQPIPDRHTNGPLRWRAPVGRHRHAGQARIARWLAALAVAVVVVVLGGTVSGELRPDERFREFVTTGAVGDWVSASGFDASVVAVRTAGTISTEDGSDLDTAGVWVLVRIRAMASEKATWIDYAVVVDSAGRSWSATQRIEQPLIDGGYRLDPRIPVEAEVAFEVPQAAATDLAVRLGEDNGLYGLQMASLMEVPLPVDAAMVAGGLAAEPVVIDPPAIVIADPQVLIGEPDDADE